MQVPENIIFDLGGVLLNIDYFKTESAFQDLGFGQFKKMYNQYSANPLFEQLETGSVSNEIFYEELIKMSEGTINRHQINQAWNAMLLDFRKQSLAFLKELSKKHQLYLLSNTNAIHHEAFMKIFTTEFGESSFGNYFIKAYYSHVLGLRKPEKNIFEFIMLDANLNPQQTLFIDDSYNNIETAHNLGFRTHLLLPGEQIEDLLRNAI
jgi:putative hydrolase of the HAD superfamily